MSQRETSVEDLVTQLEQRVDVDEQLIADLRAQCDNLQTALSSARRIGAAVGILMSSLKVTDEQAFDLLVLTSNNTQRKVRDIADELVLTGRLPQS